MATSTGTAASAAAADVTQDPSSGEVRYQHAKGNFDLGLQTWSFPNPSAMVSSYTGKTPSEGGGNVGIAVTCVSGS